MTAEYGWRVLGTLYQRYALTVMSLDPPPPVPESRAEHPWDPSGSPAPEQRSGYDHERQRWGMGDIWLGLLAGYIFVLFAQALVVAVTDYDSSLDDLPMWLFALVNVCIHVGLGLVAWVAGTKGFGWVRDFRLQMQWKDIPIGLLSGFVAQIAIGVLYLPYLELIGKDRDEVGEPARELSERAGDFVGDSALILLVGFVAPIIEEIFFRGLAFRAFDKSFAGKKWGRPAAIVISSLVFAAYHIQGLQFLALFMIGLVLAMLVHRYGRLGPAIWAHIGFNMTTVINLLYVL